MKPSGPSTKKKSTKGKTKARPLVEPLDPTTAAPREPPSALSREAVMSAAETVSTPASGSNDAGSPNRVHVSEHNARLDEHRATQTALGGLAFVVVGAIAGGLVFGASMAVLVLMAGAFVACIAFFWASLRTMLGETPLSGADAYAIGAPRAEEEQKRAVLRALKDLEFERSVGKTSEEDYRRLVAHYRGEAKRLLRLLDEEAQPMRERAEVLIAARLQAAGLAPKVAAVFRHSGKPATELAREAAAEEQSRELREAAGNPEARDESSEKAEPGSVDASGEEPAANQGESLAAHVERVEHGEEPVATGDDEETARG